MPDFYFASTKVMRNSVEFGEWRVELSQNTDSVHGAGAPSPPSEEGGGFLFCLWQNKKTEGERTRGCCLHQGVDVHKVIQVSSLFSVRLHLLLSHTLDVSLPQSSPLNPERLDSSPCTGEPRFAFSTPLCHQRYKNVPRTAAHLTFSLFNITYSLNKKGSPCGLPFQ